MGGPAAFSGPLFQARVAAYVCVHVLTQARLGWFGLSDDAPSAVSLETGSPGDDVEIEFVAGGQNADIQAKHGLAGISEVRSAVARIHARSSPDREQPLTVLLTEQDVKRGTLARVKRDLERLASGRSDALGTETKSLFDLPGVTPQFLGRLTLASLDMEDPSSPHWQSALLRLESILQEPHKAQTALTVLVERCSQLGAGRLRLDRKAIVELLAIHEIGVNPLPKDFRWHRELDHARDLLNERHTSACSGVLDKVERMIVSEDVEPRVRYRLHALRAATLHRQDKDREALDHARRALDIDGDGIHALAQAVTAAIALGETASARGYADRAMAIHSSDPIAWSANAQLAVAEGIKPTPPPTAIAENRSYLRTLAELHMIIGDVDATLSVTKKLLEMGDRDEAMLFMRANALLATDVRSDPDRDRAVYEDAERLTSEIIERLPDDNPLVHKAYILRASARRHLGRTGEAQGDMDRVYDLAPSDVDAIRNDAQWYLRAGDFDRAMQVLMHPVAAKDPMLLVLRAQTRALRDDDYNARVDVDAALTNLADAVEPEVVKMAAADVAFLIDDLALASRLVSELKGPGDSDPRFLRLRARLAVRTGNWEAGLRQYEGAMASSEGSNKDEVRLEAGRELHRAGRLSEAASVLDEFITIAHEDGRRMLARVLTELRSYSRLQQLLDQISINGSVPEWALPSAVDIALAREDVDEAVKGLVELVERGHPTPYARLYLARLLIESGRMEDALPHIETSLASGMLAPIEHMQAAKLLADGDWFARAVDEALYAFRKAPGDYRMHQGLVMITLADREGQTPTADVVGADTHVVLKRKKAGDERRYTILSQEPIDAARFELSVSDAEKAGLVGRKVGDVIPMNAFGGLLGEEWTVESIVPALLFYVQDAMLNYEVRFPNQSFIQGVKIGETGDPAGLAPLISSVHARRQYVEKTLVTYGEKHLPLGALAKLLGGSVPEIIEILESPQSPTRFLVEWSDAEGQNESRAAATEAREVVLTRSALYTASELSLLGALQRYILIAPRTLLKEVRQELAEAKKAVKEGRKSMGASASGLRLDEIEPGAPILVAEVERLERQLEWLETNARIVSRSLDRVSKSDADTEEAREWIGESAYDAWVMSEDEGWTLYADDIGIRRFIPRGSKARSFSTIGLIRALADSGDITPKLRDESLIRLLAKNHAFVPATEELILAAFSGTEIQPTIRGKLLLLLTSPALALSESAQIASAVIKRATGQGIRTVSTTTLARSLLQALASRWTAPEVCGALARYAASDLALLPQELDAVRDGCATFRKEALLIK